MMDLYLLATVRMKELRCRAEGVPVSRARILLALWLVGVARRLWPEAARALAGATR